MKKSLQSIRTVIISKIWKTLESNMLWFFYNLKMPMIRHAILNSFFYSFCLSILVFFCGFTLNWFVRCTHGIAHSGCFCFALSKAA